MRNSHKIFVGNFEGRRDHLGDVVRGFFLGGDNIELDLSEMLYEPFENVS